MVEARQPHHTLELDEDSIIVITLHGSTSEEKAASLAHDATTFFKSLAEKKFPVLFDLKKAGTISPKALNIIADLLNTPFIGRVAFTHTNKMTRFFSELVMSYTHKASGFFTHKASAKRWLRGGGKRSPAPKKKKE